MYIIVARRDAPDNVEIFVAVLALNRQIEIDHKPRPGTVIELELRVVQLHFKVVKQLDRLLVEVERDLIALFEEVREHIYEWDGVVFKIGHDLPVFVL